MKAGKNAHTRGVPEAPTCPIHLLVPANSEPYDLICSCGGWEGHRVTSWEALASPVHLDLQLFKLDDAGHSKPSYL